MKLLRCISLITLLACAYLPAHAQEDTIFRKLAFRGYVKNMQSLSRAGVQKVSLTDGFLHNRLIFNYKPDSIWTIDAEVRNRLFYGEGSRLGGAYYADILDRDNGLWDGAFVVRNNTIIWSTMIDRLWGGLHACGLARAGGPAAHRLGNSHYLDTQRPVQRVELSRF
jgi:hypothetical protein